MFVYFLLLELQALSEILGAYGIKHLGQKMMQQIASQVGEIKVWLCSTRWCNRFPFST